VCTHFLNIRDIMLVGDNNIMLLFLNIRIIIIIFIRTGYYHNGIIILIIVKHSY